MISTTTTTTSNGDASNNDHRKDTFNHHLNSKDNNWQTRFDTILEQERGVLNFCDYQVTKEHQNRMKELADTFPEIFDNSSLTPRSKWFHHPKYAMNIQMPNFHVHFRQEMQTVLGYLHKAHQAASNGTDGDPKHYIQAAFRTFRGSMQGLHGHVHIEERAYFPIFQNLYHHVDLEFLYEDHEHLHETESQLVNAMHNLTNCSKARLAEELIGTIQLAFDFDQQLMTHLGEEEEIIVPMSLALEGRLPM